MKRPHDSTDCALYDSASRTLLIPGKGPVALDELISRMSYSHTESVEFMNLLRASAQSLELAHELATARRTSTHFLEALLKGGFPEAVEQHARLGLIVRELDTCPSMRFAELLDRYQGDEGICLGVRHAIATHRNSPLAILRSLADDEADFVADAAQTSLLERESNS